MSNNINVLLMALNLLIYQSSLRHFQTFPMSSSKVLVFPVDQFAHLITMHRAELSRFITRKVGSDSLTEDILQDAYMRLVQYKTLDAIENRRAFVFRIVSNLIIDHQRSSVNKQEHDNSEETVYSIADHAPEPDSRYLMQQRMDKLKQALAELPPVCRQAFYLNRLEGHSHAEIANILHISESMVAKHLVRAMTYCRDQLKNH